MKDVKRYLNVTTIAKDALPVVKRNEPLAPTRGCIVVTRQVVGGLLTALHIELSHPSSNQLKAVTKRYQYALDIDKAIDRVTQAGQQCAALRQTPKARKEQSTYLPPEAVGVSFACDNARGDRPHNLNRHETYVVTFYILALTSISFKDFPFLYERIGGCLNIWRSRG